MRVVHKEGISTSLEGEAGAAILDSRCSCGIER